MDDILSDDGTPMLQEGPGNERTGMFGVVVDEEVYLGGGHNCEQPAKDMCSFLPSPELGSRGQWLPAPPLLARRSYPAGVAHTGKIYVIGGSADGRTLSTFEVFDAGKQKWEQWFGNPPMQTKRTMVAAAVAEDRIYVTGGFDGCRDLNSVEVFDPSSNCWNTSTDPMLYSRSYHALQTMSGKIYAIGGQERTKSGPRPRAHAKCEVFDLWSERWMEIPDLSVGRIGATANALRLDGKDYLYVMGGSDGDDVQRSGERYDPEEGVWEEVPPMSVPRLGHVAAVLNNKLYVFGGNDAKVPLDTFEVYDPVTKSWSAPIKMGVLQEELQAIENS